MTSKKSFVLYCDMIHTINKLPDDKTGLLFKKILSYVNNEEINTNDLLVEVAFEPIKQHLKRDNEKYKNIIERNRINGKKGGRPKLGEIPKEPSGLSGNPKYPKKADSVSVIDNDTDIKTTEKEKRKKKKEIMFPLNFENWPEQPTDETIKMIHSNRKHKKQPPFTQSVIDKIGAHLCDAIVLNGFTYQQCIDEWEQKGWGSFMSKFMHNEQQGASNGKPVVDNHMRKMTDEELRERENRSGAVYNESGERLAQNYSEVPF